MKTMMAGELSILVSEIFQRRGVPKVDSMIISKSIVHTNLREVNSHGVMWLENYFEQLEGFVTW